MTEQDLTASIPADLSDIPGEPVEQPEDDETQEGEETETVTETQTDSPDITDLATSLGLLPRDQFKRVGDWNDYVLREVQKRDADLTALRERKAPDSTPQHDAAEPDNATSDSPPPSPTLPPIKSLAEIRTIADTAIADGDMEPLVELLIDLATWQQNATDIFGSGLTDLYQQQNQFGTALTGTEATVQQMRRPQLVAAAIQGIGRASEADTMPALVLMGNGHDADTAVKLAMAERLSNMPEPAPAPQVDASAEAHRTAESIRVSGLKTGSRTPNAPRGVSADTPLRSLITQHLAEKRQP